MVIRDFLFLIVMNINLPSPVLPEGSLVTFFYVLPQTNLAWKQSQTKGLVTAIRKKHSFLDWTSVRHLFSFTWDATLVIILPSSFLPGLVCDDAWIGHFLSRRDGSGTLSDRRIECRVSLKLTETLSGRNNWPRIRILILNTSEIRIKLSNYWGLGIDKYWTVARDCPTCFLFVGCVTVCGSVLLKLARHSR